MKIKNLFCLIIFFTVSACVKFNGDFAKDYRKLLNVYKLNDTIYFKSNLMDYDTIRISSIDSFSTEQGPDNMPFKQVNISIEHLPNNKWNGGRELRKSSNKYDSIVGVNLLELSKTQISTNKNGDRYSIYFNYRDFSGELNLKSLKSKKIDSVFDRRETGLNYLEKYPVIVIYWSIDKGMVGYKKKDGQIYKLVD